MTHNANRSRVNQYLAHAENRIHLCQANALLWDAKGDGWLADQARKEAYEWISKAQDQHQEDHY